MTDIHKYHYFNIKCPNCGGTLEEILPAKDKYVLLMYECTCCNLDHLDAEVLRTFIKRIVVIDTMPGKKGKGIEVKLEYTIDGEYKTYSNQQDRKTA